MRTMSKITGVSVVCSTVSSGTDQRKHQSSVSLVFVRGIHRWPVTLTKGQWRGKCFHLMTSSWSNHGKQSADRTVYGLVKFKAFLILDCISVISPNIVWLTSRRLRPTEIRGDNLSQTGFLGYNVHAKIEGKPWSIYTVYAIYYTFVFVIKWISSVSAGSCEDVFISVAL